MLVKQAYHGDTTTLYAHHPPSQPLIPACVLRWYGRHLNVRGGSVVTEGLEVGGSDPGSAVLRLSRKQHGPQGADEVRGLSLRSAGRQADDAVCVAAMMVMMMVVVTAPLLLLCGGGGSRRRCWRRGWARPR